MAHRSTDPLIGVVAALPDRLRTTETITAIAEAAAEADPAYWVRPLVPAEAAAFLGTTTGALATARFRGDGPPYGKLGGAVRYASRLELLRYVRSEAGLDTHRHWGAAA